MIAFEYAIVIAAGYLFGSIPTGLVVGYAFTGGDIRERGSGKTGATNVLRTAGRTGFALVVVVDVLKGVVPALIGRFAFGDYGVASAGAGAAIVGHVYPVFAGFRGGRGIATAFGGLLALAPLLGIFLPLVAALVVGLTRYMSLMSVTVTCLAAIVTVIFAFTGDIPVPVAIFAIFAALFLVYMHLPNIRRLLDGTEPKLGRGGERPASG